MGIVNGIANAMGIVVPMVVALMVDGNVSQQIYVATIIRLKFKLDYKNHFFKFKRNILLQQTFAGWRTVYLIAMSIYVFGAVIWTFFGTADVQDWDTYWMKDENKKSGGYLLILIYFMML